MKVVAAPAGVRSILRTERLAGATVGFVATMGALHEGHLSLVRTARAANDVVVVSIFVNPLQFGPGEDLETYPRTTDIDLRLAETEGADLVFMPAADDMYPPGSSTTISVGEIGTIVEGAHRPGHFDGVCTVVAKLVNIVEPDRAYFGQKDAQQVAVLKRMVRDLDFDVELVVCPTVREPDGLAISSRNIHLRGVDRARAVTLHAALSAGAEILVASGDLHAAEDKMRAVLDATPGVDPDYALAVDPMTFGPPGDGGSVLLVAAARVGSTRLIDNALIEREETVG